MSTNGLRFSFYATYHTLQLLKKYMSSNNWHSFIVIVSFKHFFLIKSRSKGADKRPRFILVEFNTWADRNLVKKAAESLKGHPESKKYFVKADITKNEREELTRFI